MLLWQLLSRQMPYQGLMQSQIIIGLMDGSLQPQWPENDPMPGLVQVGQPACVRSMLGHRCHVSHS